MTGEHGPNLARFHQAQQPVFAEVRAELRGGRKLSHWMWFVFPQLAGLGASPIAQFYALSSLAEARAFFADPILGPRLREATALVLGHGDKSLHRIFGAPDDAKFRSCMTLFEQAAPQEPLFSRALAVFCAGGRDPRTLALLAV